MYLTEKKIDQATFKLDAGVKPEELFTTQRAESTAKQKVKRGVAVVNMTQV
ncbi:hypothetical protein [Janthinobacterium sp. BJB304]|uniref:hypothetical protein n=1 Tax=Janthinobacterium sp. BJB304 TaxID=1572871 RepID=UPI0015D4D025|nr:hypothetical protein [Janthinobacterium sp. BJB304]